MVLMRKGDAVEYVPDVFVDAYRADGYVAEGEEAAPAAPENTDPADEGGEGEETDPAEEEGRFVCPHCGKEYKTEANLAKHIAEKHAE